MSEVFRFTVRHSCGHEAEHAMRGSEADRAQRELGLRRMPCAACWRAAQAEALGVQAKDLDLPPLNGPLYEIAWAETIRVKAIAHNERYRDDLIREGAFRENEPVRRAVLAAADAAIQDLRNERSANWWIAHRFDVLNAAKQRVFAAAADLLRPPAGPASPPAEPT